MKTVEQAGDDIAAIQTIVGVKADRIWGPITQKAVDDLIALSRLPRGDEGIRRGMASSFADPADIKAFKACKAQGNTDLFCFSKGDNGIGIWGDRTDVDKPYCAIPRDDWQHLGDKARGRKVEVTIGDKTVICELRDTMKWRRNITNGTVIDLNPGALKLFGLKPPILKPCSWKWATP